MEQKMEYLEELKLPLSKGTNGADRTTQKSLIFHLLRKRESNFETRMRN